MADREDRTLNLTDAQVVALMQTGTPLAKARRAFNEFSGKIEQTRRLTPIQLRRLEFNAVLHIVECFLPVERRGTYVIDLENPVDYKL